MSDEELESKDTLGDRMKRYESEALYFNQMLDKYVVIRLDGNHFHTWVRKAGLKRPFDNRMISAMQKTTIELCKRINTCIMGYCQSDEITIALKRGENENSEPWFLNRVQKLCSISASICSVAFNDAIREQFGDEYVEPAYFDSRVMFLPNLDEVVNNFIWRQNDCIKNSISSYAQSMFSSKELLNKDRVEQLLMMQIKRRKDWNELSSVYKYGTFVHKEKIEGCYNGQAFYRGVFVCDCETPVFSKNKQSLIDAYNFKIDNGDAQ